MLVAVAATIDDLLSAHVRSRNHSLLVTWENRAMASRHVLNVEVLEARNMMTATVATAATVLDPTTTQSPTVQTLGQNALPATDVPGTWQATGSLTNAIPWALVDGNLTGLGGVTRVESLESTALGIFAPLARTGHGAALQEPLAHPRDSDADDAHSASLPEELPPPEMRLRR